MQTQLPRRPFTELPAPPSGFAGVRREATRRRRRRAVTVVSGGVTAVVVTTLALLLGRGADGNAVLRPAPVTPATGLPTPGGVSTPAAAPASTPHAVGPARPARPASGDAPGPTAPVASGTADAATAPAPIVLTRTRSSYTGSPRVCRTGASSTDTSAHAGDDWCLTATAVPVPGGVRLTFSACRDSTTGGTLTFASTREVELVVKRGDAVVWSWSHDHPGEPSPHSLSSPANGCWDWSLVWPGTSSSGTAVGHGAYTVVGTGAADEIYGAAPATDDFDY